MQSDVVSALRALALPVREELVTAQGYSLDAVVTHEDCEVAVEIDGPWHFMGRTPICHRRFVRALRTQG